MKGYSLLLPLVFAMNMVQAQTPPDVEKRPHTVKSPHDERQDEYYWLRDDARKDAKMLAYLQGAGCDRPARLIAPNRPPRRAGAGFAPGRRPAPGDRR